MENYLQDIAYPNPRDGKMILPTSFRKKEMFEVYLAEKEKHSQYNQFKEVFKKHFSHYKSKKLIIIKLPL